MKITYVRKTITIKRRIIPDDRLIHFIHHNSNKRHYMWNKFVEEYKRCKENDDFIDTVRYITKINNEDKAQLKEAIKNGDDDIALMYCSDIPKSIYRDIKRAMKMMKTKAERYGEYGEFHFKKYDRFRHSFKVRTNNEMSEKTGLPKGKVNFIDATHLVFKAANHHVQNTFNVTFKEPVCDEYDEKHYRFVSYSSKYSSRERYDFHHEDIKEIGFMEEIGKFYIMLVCTVTFYNYNDNEMPRKKLAGIDLGIQNPVVIYDGDNDYIGHLPDSAIGKMKRYEAKCDKLDSILKHKLSANTHINSAHPDHPIYSKRHYKLHRRFRKFYKRISDIRKDWRNKLANRLSQEFDVIVVDEFRTPDNTHINTKSVKEKLNKYNRFHAMRMFTDMLIHESMIHSCRYVEAPQFTTRTCSECYHLNPKLELQDRTFVCEKCGCTLDRDINAARNCYDSYKHKSRWLFN